MIIKWFKKYKLHCYMRDLMYLQAGASINFYKHFIDREHPLHFDEANFEYTMEWVSDNRIIRFRYRYHDPLVELEYNDSITFMQSLMSVKLDDPIYLQNKIKRKMRLEELQVIMEWFDNELPLDVRKEMESLSGLGIKTYPLGALVKTLDKLNEISI